VSFVTSRDQLPLPDGPRGEIAGALALSGTAAKFPGRRPWPAPAFALWKECPI